MNQIVRQLDQAVFEQAGIPARQHRGKWLVGELFVDALVNSHPVNFTRRNYGNGQFYCWAEVWHAGDWHSLGDPWPCHTPKGRELAAEVDRLVARLAAV